MDDATLVAFTLVTIISIASPGPDMLLALSNGSRFGVRRACIGMAGVILADLILIAVVAAGFGALFVASELLFSIFKWVGVCYLAFLGIRLLASGGLSDELSTVEKRASERSESIFLKGVLIAVSNPKNYLFFAALLPQFIDPGRPQSRQYLEMSLIVAIVDIVAMLAYAGFGSQIVRFLKKPGAVWLDRLCGITFLVLAGSLALYRHSERIALG